MLQLKVPSKKEVRMLMYILELYQAKCLKHNAYHKKQNTQLHAHNDLQLCKNACACGHYSEENMHKKKSCFGTMGLRIEG